MSEPQANHEKPRRRTWLKVLCIVSLSLNLLIIGAIGSRLIFGPPHARGTWRHAPEARPGALFHAGRHVMRKAERPRRAELRTVIAANRADLAKSFIDLGRARLSLASALTHEPYDEQAVSRALEEVKAAESRTHDAGLTLTRAFIFSLKPDERRRFARFLKHPRRHRHWQWRP